MMKDCFFYNKLAVDVCWRISYNKKETSNAIKSSSVDAQAEAQIWQARGTQITESLLKSVL